MSDTFECQNKVDELITDFKEVCSDNNKLAYARSKYDVKIRPPLVTETEVQQIVSFYEPRARVAKQAPIFEEKVEIVENRLQKENDYRFESVHIPNERGESFHHGIPVSQSKSALSNNMTPTPSKKMNRMQSYSMQTKIGRFMSDKQQTSHNDTLSAQKFLQQTTGNGEKSTQLYSSSNINRTPQISALNLNPLNPSLQNIGSSQRSRVAKNLEKDNFSKIRISQYSNHKVESSSRSELRNTNYYDQKLQKAMGRKSRIQKLGENTKHIFEKNVRQSGYQRAFGKLYLQDEVFRNNVGDKLGHN